MKQYIVLALVFLAACSSAPSAEVVLEQEELDHTSLMLDSGGGNQAGEKAIDFQLTDVEGNTFKLSELRGQPVLLFFWASWCPHCRNDLQEFKKTYPDYKDDVKFIAISMDVNEKDDTIKKYAAKYGSPGMTWADAPRKVLQDYDIIYTTTKLAISKDGTIVWRGSGEMTAEVQRKLLEGVKTA